MVDNSRIRLTDLSLSISSTFVYQTLGENRATTLLKYFACSEGSKWPEKCHRDRAYPENTVAAKTTVVTRISEI